VSLPLVDRRVGHGDLVAREPVGRRPPTLSRHVEPVFHLARKSGDDRTGAAYRQRAQGTSLLIASMLPSLSRNQAARSPLPLLG
jgi:hypothetical protein